MRRFVRFEHKRQKVVPPRVFLLRLGRNVLVALGFIGASLLVGMAGYMGFEGKDGIAAFDNAAMILSGMGPFDMARTDAGRLFEGAYALYSGLLLVLTSSLILAPVFHRVLHSFHVEDDEDEKAQRPAEEATPKTPSRRA